MYRRTRKVWRLKQVSIFDNFYFVRRQHVEFIDEHVNLFVYLEFIDVQKDKNKVIRKRLGFNGEETLKQLFFINKGARAKKLSPRKPEGR